MSQIGVLEFLIQNKKKWFLASEISEKIGVGRNNVILNLSKLLRHPEIYEVECKWDNENKTKYGMMHKLYSYRGK